jgi:hypothetical protein
MFKAQYFDEWPPIDSAQMSPAESSFTGVKSHVSETSSLLRSPDNKG